MLLINYLPCVYILVFNSRTSLSWHRLQALNKVAHPVPETNPNGKFARNFINNRLYTSITMANVL